MRYGGLIAAVVFAAIAAIIVMRMAGGEEQAPAVAPQAVEQKTVNVYIAAKPITIGSTLTAEDVVAQPWPAHLALEGFIMADGKTNVVGMVARSPFQVSEPLINTKLANPNDPNFLAGDLPAGMRVITIPVDEIDGVAGFVYPGDAVDVIFTHVVPKWVEEPVYGAGGAPDEAVMIPKKITETVSETLLTNVKVLAVDQRASSVGATNEKGDLKIPRSASLMVSQEDAQRVRLAQKTGTLSLVLRSLADKEAVDPLTLTSPANISQSKDGTDGLNGVGAKQKIIIRRGQQKEIESLGSPSASRKVGANLLGEVAVKTSAGLTNTVPPTPSGSNVVTPGQMAIP